MLIQLYLQRFDKCCERARIKKAKKILRQQILLAKVQNQFFLIKGLIK